MTPHLNNAIVQFIANEFKLLPENINEELSFKEDLGLSPNATQDLLQRLQDALDFVLPEDISTLETLGDLFNLVRAEESEETSELI